MKPSRRFRGERDERRLWPTVVAVALMLHLVLFVSVGPRFFERFRRAIVDTPPSAARGGAPPDAIVVIPVVVEDAVTPVEPRPPKPTVPSPPRPTPRPGPRTDATIDVLDLVAQGAAPRIGAGTSTSARIPPQPLEITWPRTRRLGHCHDLRLDIRVRVAADGRVLDVEAPPGPWPRDCVDAALEAARRIRFAPGTIDGRPVVMWTRVRIDFRARR